MPGPVVNGLHTHPHAPGSSRVEQALLLFYEGGRGCSASRQAVEGPVASTQHSQDVHPGLSDAEARVYNNCISLTLL